ncbi:MAG: phosphoribosylformylglycinamidine cyclo-ligase [Gammaproteobacteria bacterium]|nr:phosphoribosylformylglycinamidine cyclo-ligase [Gammaproteobacteria bacterium]
MKNKNLTYADSGVDIDSANSLITKIKPSIKETLNSNVLSQIGGFGALFELETSHYKRPILVSGTDGVGTKVMLAKEFEKLDLIGIDLVAMCVNDIITLGAKPLFFLDYYATSKLDVDSATKVINGIADGCKESKMALIGGETAEMPGVYKAGDFDLAGFCVGVVDYDNIIDGEKIEESNIIIGIASSGPHSNGYSLIRKIIELNGINKDKMLGEKKLIDAITAPTTIYVDAILNLTKSYDIKGIAHITGGGFKENIVRILNKNSNAMIDSSSWDRPPIFQWLQEKGNITDDEMLKTFNCGIGMAIIIDRKDQDEVIKNLSLSGHKSFVIGEIKSGNQTVTIE